VYPSYISFIHKLQYTNTSIKRSYRKMKKQIEFFSAVTETMDRLGKSGCLLIAGRNGNPMTIGWGTIGIIWAKPVFTVLVRPSRFTHELIEESDEFSVNVLTEKYDGAIAICGTNSGRDMDKIERCGLTLEEGKHIAIPHIGESFLYYECKTIHKNNVVSASLDRSLRTAYYTKDDFHTIYFGEILGVYGERSS
jgi:flavin reductase (DIM6/NTAB) family NADH-FMN oxidoreductase RutF